MMTEQMEKVNAAGREAPLGDETTKKLTAAIEASIPQSLDNIIRINRDKAQLRLTNDEEIFKLHQVIAPGEPKDVIDDWNFITLYQPDLNFGQTFLLGDVRQNGHQRITSVVTGIDLDKQLIVTKSGSLYQLGTPKNGEPDVNQLYMVCSAFHDWGIGTMLGVPHFFY